MGRIAQSRAVQWLAGSLLAAYMATVKRTTRWDVRHADRVAHIVNGNEGVIALTWHSRFLMLNSAWQRGWQMPHVMISRSRDGNIVHHTSRMLGLQTIRGSSRKIGSTRNKGGGRASTEVLQAVREGGCIVITPDGPRGPRQHLQIGALRLARLTGAPLMPCSFAVARRKLIDSWDRLVLPGLFGRGVILWGEPVSVPSDMSDDDLEKLRQSLEARMNADLAEADRLCGHAPILPAQRSAA